MFAGPARLDGCRIFTDHMSVPGGILFERQPIAIRDWLALVLAFSDTHAQGGEYVALDGVTKAREATPGPRRP